MIEGQPLLAKEYGGTSDNKAVRGARRMTV